MNSNLKMSANVRSTAHGNDHGQNGLEDTEKSNQNAKRAGVSHVAKQPHPQEPQKHSRPRRIERPSSPFNVLNHGQVAKNDWTPHGEKDFGVKRKHRPPSLT